MSGNVANESVVGWVVGAALSLPEYSDKLLWIGAALLVTVPVFFRQVRIAVRIVYEMKLRRDRSSFGRARKILSYAAIPFRGIAAVFLTMRILAPNLVGLREFGLSEIVRIWIEYDIFEAEMNWQWSDLKREGSDDPLTITVAHPGEVIARVERIDRYCKRIHLLSAKGRQGRAGFICPIQISSGFIAAFTLLSGLQNQFGTTWPPIIDGFEKEAQLDDVLEDYGISLNFQQIQSYTYYCWLLWGPSIPVCAPSCQRWDKGYMFLQYGFGDENNSIDIVGERAFLSGALKRFLPDAIPRPDGKIDKGVMAVPASVTGRLRYDDLSTFNDSELSPAIRDRLESKPPERRSLLFVEQIAADAKDSNRSLYYSGYIWVMFMILAPQTTRAGNKVWLPLHPDIDPATGRSHRMRSVEPWKDAIPFFEHGNFADPETCLFGKKQLVEKALAGLTALIRESGGESFPLRFAYAGAIDDPNCNWDPKIPEAERVGQRRDQLAFPELSGGRLIVDMLRKRIEEEAGKPGSEIGRLGQGVEPLVDFEVYDNASGHHPHSTCHLPVHIRLHFDDLQKKLKQPDRRT